jgi:hypothetical protein
MTIHAPSDTTLFETCLRLFERYRLAITMHPADGTLHPVDGGSLSMVLLSRATGVAGYYVLTQAREDLFVLRSWERPDGISQEIRPGEPVPGPVRQLIAASMPIPHDGALLGWVTDNQVTAMLAVHCRPPEPWDISPSVPEIRVMPMSGTWELLHWPPFTASPLEDVRLWDYVEWGEIVDIGPLVIQSAGQVFWVPSPDRRSARHGYIVVMGNLPAEEFWLPAGVYTDHWTLREGIEPPSAGQLLTLPGAVDLADRFR